MSEPPPEYRLTTTSNDGDAVSTDLIPGGDQPVGPALIGEFLNKTLSTDGFGASG